MHCDLYVITDSIIGNGLSHAEMARLAVAGGADIIQLRDKALSCRELLKEASEIREVTLATGALFIVNDRLDVALAAGADGVHLGQDDLSVEMAREIAPEDFIIGVSVGDLDEALSAEAGGADYVALSPTFSTPSKANAGPGHGLDVLSAISSAVSIPLIAIGGIGPENVGQVISSGADGVAVISAVVGQEDVSGAAQEMKALITSAKSE